MPLSRYALLGLALVLAAPAALAQPDRPASADPAARPLAEIARYALPVVDNDALLARDADTRDPLNPEALQFAEPFEVALRPDASGTWETLPSGVRVWRLVVTSPGAHSLNVGFVPFHLPEGAALWVYPAGGSPTFRAFTAADNNAARELWTPVVLGDEMTIELNVPDTKAPLAYELGVARISHAYRPFGVPGADLFPERGGSCNVDVVCPQGDAHRDVIRSVGAYMRGGTRVCSGAAINNTSQDSRPLYLTANHCGTSAGNASSVIVYWNYENSTCRPPNTPAAGGAGDGQLTQFNTGATLLGSNSGSDWALLEFNSPLDPAHNVFLAGWDRRNQVTQSSVAIHHPRVLEKRISFDNDPSVITNYLGRTPNASGTHLWVVNWEQGTTEGGSSGSPLFSPEKRIVGQLHGGYAACTNNLDDWYGRVYHSMNTGLAQHLDPSNSNVEVLDGRESGSGLIASWSFDPGFVTPGDPVSFTVTLTNASDDPMNGIAFSNPLPAMLSFVEILSNSAGTASGGSTVSWTVDLAPDQSATLVYVVEVSENADDSVQNTATVTHPDLEAPIALAATIPVFIEADYVFSNSTVVSIPDNQCPTYTTSTISVPESFAWTRMKVGVQVQHTWRGDLRIRVQSPSGTVVNLLERVGSSADNLDALFSDDGPEGAFSSGSHALGSPPYQVEGRPQRAGSGGPVQPLSTFNGEDPSGTWTLGICDGAAADLGSIRQWALLFYAPSTRSEDAAPLAGGYALDAAFPNPFAGATTLSLRVERAQAVRAEVYDAVGRRVLVLHDGPVSAGAEHALTLDGSALPAGVYVVRVTGEAFAASRRVLLVR